MKTIDYHSSSGTSCRLDLAQEVRRTATQSTDASSPYWYRPCGPAGTYKERVPQLLLAGKFKHVDTQSQHALKNTLTSMRTPSLREQNSPSCVPAQLRGAEIAPYARADDRGGQRVLHRAGVEDADNVAGPGRRERAEERPVQPVLTVQLDDLRKHPSESRYAAVTHRGWRTKPILIAQI